MSANLMSEAIQVFMEPITSSKDEIDFYLEMANAEAAWDEVEKTGKTVRCCLRCSMEFVFEETNSSYVIRCQTLKCFVLTARGI